MGHSDVSTTLNRYTGSVPSVLREAADGLEAVLGA
jgi:hypothetical protein